MFKSHVQLNASYTFPRIVELIGMSASKDTLLQKYSHYKTLFDSKIYKQARVIS